MFCDRESERKPLLACIVGATACRKTELSILIAKAFDGEIISADSVQVYRGMDVGSAKPTLTERQGVLHHMIDCVEIGAPYFSVAEYRSMATDAIHDAVRRGKLPIVVGGSGLYINALTYPLRFAIPSDPSVRERLEREYETDGEGSFARLAAVDPVAAKRLHRNDKKRIVRALEVYECSGKPFSAFGNDFLNEQAEPIPFDPLLFGLTIERENLYARIDRRVDEMMQKGFLAEAKRLYDGGYDRKLPAMQSIGYRQLFAYFAGEISLSDAVEQVKRETRRFAKRQATWFRRDERIQWFPVDTQSLFGDAVFGIKAELKQRMEDRA